MTESSEFPYEKFPHRLEYGEKKNTTVCWFECEEHLQKYMLRSKLDKKKVKISHANH